MYVRIFLEIIIPTTELNKFPKGYTDFFRVETLINYKIKRILKCVLGFYLKFLTPTTELHQFPKGYTDFFFS